MAPAAAGNFSAGPAHPQRRRHSDTAMCISSILEYNGAAVKVRRRGGKNFLLTKDNQKPKELIALMIAELIDGVLTAIQGNVDLYPARHTQQRS